MYYFLLLLVLFSCNDYSIKESDTLKPELVVYPNILDFGNIISGSETGINNFVVINSGEIDLVITKPSLPTNVKFYLDENLAEEFVLEPDQTLGFDVYYDPTTFESNEAIISFESNDDDEEYYELPLMGRGDAPLISVDPVDLDFGNVSIGCDLEETITISNVGNMDLLIAGVNQLVSSPIDMILHLELLPDFPWVILPGEVLDMTINYLPSDVSSDESIVSILSNDPENEEMEISQAGNGDILHWYNDRYQQTEVKQVDIVFVVDNSGSMLTKQQQLALQMSDFINILINSQVDYHIGFITTDSFVFVVHDGVEWIDNTYLYPEYWLNNIVMSIGTGGSAYEQGIYNAYLFTDSMSNSLNDYWRDSASYIVIYISDEPDYSPQPHQSYYNFFDSIKSDINLVKQFAVIGDYPTGCSLQSGPGLSLTIPFGRGYYEMTQRYQGDSYSICAVDWGTQMQDLASIVSMQNTFSLTQVDVIPETIEVRINSQLNLSWVYNMQSNSIVFDMNDMPEAGDIIDIDYAILGCNYEN